MQSDLQGNLGPARRDEGFSRATRALSYLKDPAYAVWLSRAHDLAIKIVASDQLLRLGEPVLKGIPPGNDLSDEIRLNGFMVISQPARIYRKESKGRPYLPCERNEERSWISA